MCSANSPSSQSVLRKASAEQLAEPSPLFIDLPAAKPIVRSQSPEPVADASHERPAVPNQRNLSVLLRHCSANGIRGIELAQQHVAFAMAADICPIPRTMSVVSAPLKSTESLTPPSPTLSTTSTLSGRYSATKDER